MLNQTETQKLWEEYLKEKGKAWLKVESGSMFPMIPVGSNILVKRCHFKKFLILFSKFFVLLSPKTI